MIVPATYFDVKHVDSEKDNSMIWAAGLLPGRSNIPATQIMKDALPQHCSVE